MRLNIAKRLWLPTLAVAALVLALASAVALRTTGQIALADASLQASERKLLDALTWRGLTQASAMHAVASLGGHDAAQAAVLQPEVAETMARLSDLQNRVDAAASNPGEREALARIAAVRQADLAARGAAAQLQAGGDAVATKAMLATTVRPAVARHLALQQDYVDILLAHSSATRAQVGAERLRTVWLVIGLMAVVVLGLVLCTLMQVRAICAPMGRLAEVARRIGDGELDADVDTSRDDEIGSVQRALAAMRDALRGIVGQVRQAAESIQVASTEVASGNADLSQRTELAASSLQQTASSLHQLTAHVRQSADAAAQANLLAASAQAVAQRGGAVVSQVVATMDEINASSKRIADIIGTIDGIAFQTNILALNAAVEAARAGEQGRGFAVVASEVRSLAQRSAEAAREIKGLIGSSVAKVETGARLVQNAGSTMGEIVASVQRVSDVIGEITAAASQQSSGIGSVNGAIGSLDQMTQQNAALVEESAAASESLKDQARRLMQTMQVFRLTASATVAAASPPPAAAPVPNRSVPARPPQLAQAAIHQARATSRPGAAAADDDWESF